MELASEGSPTAALKIMRGVSEAGVWVQHGDSAIRFVSRKDLSMGWSGAVWILIPSEYLAEDLKPGGRGERVARLQDRLARIGYWDGKNTGVYDENTRRRVMAFQKDMNLHVDGRAGAHTLGMILQLIGEDGDGS
jgi:peptidoglycan hydrolase-like protein with peptidoglycan-binding domain